MWAITTGDVMAPGIYPVLCIGFQMIVLSKACTLLFLSRTPQSMPLFPAIHDMDHPAASNVRVANFKYDTCTVPKLQPIH